MSEVFNSYSNKNFSSDTCDKCSLIENELINNIRGTDEYRKSLAISEAIKFLLLKIQNLEQEKEELMTINGQQENQINILEEELEKERKRLILELEGFESLKNIMIERNESLSKLNENNKQLISDIELKNNEENLKNKDIINELKKEIEFKSNVNSTMKKKIESHIEKDEKHKEEIKNIRYELDEKIKVLENEKLKIHQDSILAEIKYKKMIKDLELLVYKVNLENFNLKDKLENLPQTGNDVNKFLLSHNTGNLKETPTPIKPTKEYSSLENCNEKNIKNSSYNFRSKDSIKNKKSKNIDENVSQNIYSIPKAVDIDKEIEHIENWDNNYERLIQNEKKLIYQENNRSISDCHFQKDVKNIIKNDYLDYTRSEGNKDLLINIKNSMECGKMETVKTETDSIALLPNDNLITSNSLEDEFNKFYKNININKTNHNHTNSYKNLRYGIDQGSLEIIKENASNEISNCTNQNDSKDKSVQKCDFNNKKNNYSNIKNYNLNNENFTGNENINSVDKIDPYKTSNLNLTESIEINNKLNYYNGYAGSNDENSKNINISNINNSYNSNDMGNCDMNHFVADANNNSNYSYKDSISVSDIKNLTIEEIVREIMNTDRIIKEYSQKLNYIQSTSSGDENNKNFRNKKNYLVEGFKDIMQFLEERTEYLFKLKKHYNFLYKKLNNIV